MSQDKERIESQTELDKFVERNFYSQVREPQVIGYLVQQDNALTSAREELAAAKAEQERRKKIYLDAEKDNLRKVEQIERLQAEVEKLKKDRDEDMLELLDHILTETFGYYKHQDGDSWFVEKSTGRKLTSEELLSDYKKIRENLSGFRQVD